jgi:uncharacterized damage-inducible protein DinB
MTKEALLGEFLFEAENTRRLLNAIPETALGYRPQPQLWSIAELAAHIAEVYHWFKPTFNQDVMDMSRYQYDKGDISTTASIVAKLEENIREAKTVVENVDESTLNNTWHMQMDGNDIMPPMPRHQVIRTFLLNHLYHHRGEMVAYLRASGNRVPGLYGPTYEESQAMAV